MRLLFWRKRGRHALGAAVTAIPSAPVRPAVPAPAEPVPAPVPVAEPDLMTSIAQLIATGEAWAEPGESRARPGAEPAAEVVPATVVPATVVQEPVVPALVLEAQPIAPPVPPAPAPLPAGLPRVQLGFRDGTSTALEPGSEQSLALEQLAQSLTRRD